MVPRRAGKIVNIASILGLVGSNDSARPGTIAYNTSKGGVISFTRSLAAEWAQYDINVNAIAPGFFPTKMTKGLMEMLGERVASKAPLNRVAGKPKTIPAANATSVAAGIVASSGQPWLCWRIAVV